MGKLMVRFAVAHVARGDCLLKKIRESNRVDRINESSFWMELFVFAIFPVDIVLASSDFSRAIEVRRATSQFAFAHLDQVFEQDNYRRTTEVAWNQLVHDRFAEYWSCVKVDDGKALEL